MKCSSCGKEVPFAGNVCPWCHTNKQGDQAQQIALMVGVVLGGTVGFGVLTALDVDSFSAKLGVLFAFVVVFGIIGARAKTEIDRKAKSEAVSSLGPLPSIGGDIRVCPFCAETIKRAAKLCRFCNRDLPAG